MNLDNTQIGLIVVVGGALMGFLLKLWSFEKGLAERMQLLMQAMQKPQAVSVQSPLVISPEERWATKEEIDEIRNHIDKLSEKIDRLGNEIRTNQELRGKSVHERINVLLEAVAEVRGEMRRMNHHG